MRGAVGLLFDHLFQTEAGLGSFGFCFFNESFIPASTSGARGCHGRTAWGTGAFRAGSEDKVGPRPQQPQGPSLCRWESRDSSSCLRLKERPITADSNSRVGAEEKPEHGSRNGLGEESEDANTGLVSTPRARGASSLHVCV